MTRASRTAVEWITVRPVSGSAVRFCIRLPVLAIIFAVKALPMEDCGGLASINSVRGIRKTSTRYGWTPLKREFALRSLPVFRRHAEEPQIACPKIRLRCRKCVVRTIFRGAAVAGSRLPQTD
ncbi:hypothetical protein [Thermogutta terrifontis]|nr:hypothetical protein [Thermogutta terrifontis]